jgi:hypothetical protein
MWLRASPPGNRLVRAVDGDEMIDAAARHPLEAGREQREGFVVPRQDRDQLGHTPPDVPLLDVPNRYVRAM